MRNIDWRKNLGGRVFKISKTSLLYEVTRGFFFIFQFSAQAREGGLPQADREFIYRYSKWGLTTLKSPPSESVYRR